MEAASSHTTAHWREILNNSFKMRSSMNLVQYVWILRMAPTPDTPNIQQHLHTRSDQQLCSMQAQQQSAAFGLLGGSKSDGERGYGSQLFFFFAQSPETKLHIRRELCSSGELECMPIENQIVDAGIDDEAIDVRRPKCCCDRTWTDQTGDPTPCCAWPCPASDLV